MHERLIEAQLSGEVGLGQWWAFVWCVGFVADQCDRASESFVAYGFGALCSGKTAADYHARGCLGHDCLRPI
jgi:hypothetical protein